MQIEAFFSKTARHLWFIWYADRSNYTFKKNPFDVSPIQIWRNLGEVYKDMPEYDESNTVLITNFDNLV